VESKNGLEVFPKDPRRERFLVEGKDNEEKTQVQYMVSHLLKLHTKIQADAADALAIALCHAYVLMNWKLNNAMIESRIKTEKTEVIGKLSQVTQTAFSRRKRARKRNYKWPNYQNNK